MWPIMPAVWNNTYAVGIACAESRRTMAATRGLVEEFTLSNVGAGLMSTAQKQANLEAGLWSRCSKSDQCPPRLITMPPDSLMLFWKALPPIDVRSCRV